MPIVSRDESYAIVGAAMEVYNHLGIGFLEPVYQEALEIEFQKRFIHYEREKELVIYYDGHPLQKTYKADFICYDRIIVELKAVSEINDTHRSQLFNYLHATGLKLGILINFGNDEGLQWERKVL